jgi:hypothetical protein
MRVYVEHDMTVNHNTSVVTLKAGQIVEGPLAVYLVESDCNVTIEQDDRPAPVAEQTPAEEADPKGAPVETGATPGEESHTPGAGEAATEPAGAEPAEPTAEPGPAE